MNMIFKLPRPIKRLISVFIDSFFIVSSFWFALFLRFENGIDIYNASYWTVIAWVIPFAIMINISLGLYRAVIRYLSSTAITAVCLSVVTSTIVLALSALFFEANIPRSTPIIFGSFLLILIGGSRLMVRSWASRLSKNNKINVLVYGAGTEGIQLVNSLIKCSQYLPKFFIDDNKKLKGLIINNMRVYQPSDIERLIVKYDIKRILLALPSNSRSNRARILNSLAHIKVEILAMPVMSDLVSGKIKIDDFVEVNIEDLLGRDTVPAKASLLNANIKNKVVMVTGAGGSIGAELCRQIILQAPTKLILFEASEANLYLIHKELENYIFNNNLTVELFPILGRVQNKLVSEKVLKNFKVQTVYHAAAHKHVPMVEGNVVEGVNNNVFGTLHLAQAAIAADVDTFVLISTDKAVRPTNVMGATKRMAELCLQALANNNHHTRFCMVRFGNVLGSSGSVIPLFKSQIKQGGPITLTHKDITRYFMTIPEAAQLVIQAGAMGKGGDVFVLDMGKSVKIYDLATKLINLSGLQLINKKNPYGDIAIIETGLRPGEKLYEELLIGDDVGKTEHERIMSAHEVFLPWSELNVVLEKLQLACINFDQHSIRDILLNAPTGFAPSDGICDYLYHQTQQSKARLKQVS
ncbi:polysaccharide biosynthesis protein [Colwellia sp. C1TZA3]|uniref:polysaccharide biosynthesis protein n=1 Tax=Colwellia sp. C1TZA3 TaxID=2508879 RepID=UPI0011B963C9|nr:nucleoside-diphosphate sugar epimerase/dehydratase [Colwellia sp. C1TZA3]TWX72945.1 polysaccharide biosynthesis protein [Colwellia sp. C1TZA3]